MGNLLAVAVHTAFIVLRQGASAWTLLSLAPAEAVILLAESLLYHRFFTGQTKSRAVIYGVFSNLCSAVLGIIVMDYVWNSIASIL